MNIKNFIDCFEEYIIAVLICMMIVLETINAILHVTGSVSLGIPQEVAIYCYVWITFLSAAFCAKKSCDIAVTMLADKYPEKFQKMLRSIKLIINMVTAALLAIGGCILVARTAASGAVGELSGLPLAPIYVSSVIGFGLSLIRNIQVFMAERNNTREG